MHRLSLVSRISFQTKNIFSIGRKLGILFDTSFTRKLVFRLEPAGCQKKKKVGASNKWQGDRMSWVYTKLVNMDNNLFVNKSTIFC